MKILNTDVGRDAIDIISSTVNGSGVVSYRLELFTKAGLSIEPLQIGQIQLVRDFAKGVTDQITVTCTISRGEFENLIYPNRRDLRAILHSQGAGLNKTVSGESLNTLYRAYLVNPKDESVVNAGFTGDSLETKDQNLVDFVVQLEEEGYRELASTDISTVPYQASMEDLIQVFGSGLGRHPISVYPPDNADPISQLVLPDGTSAVEIANWLQKFGPGVYNHGCATYYLGGWVFVYPQALLGNQPGRKRMVIVRTAQDELLGVENTYGLKGETIYLLATGQAQYVDTTESTEALQGTAVRFSEPTYQDGRVKHKDGRTEFHNTGYKILAQEDRRINVSRVHKLNTSNPHYEVSRLALNQGKRLSLQWDNPNPALIRPNMEVEIYYMSSGQLTSLTGIVESFIYTSERDPSQPTKSLHRATAVLSLLIQ